MEEKNVNLMENDEKLWQEAIDNISEIGKGNIVKGKIVKITPEDIFVDIGYKSEGIIPSKEFQNLNVDLKEGQEIKALVVRFDDGKGHVKLSHLKALEREVWNELFEAKKEGKVIECVMDSQIKGGYRVKYKGVIDCFLPRPLLSYQDKDKKNIKVKVIEIDKRNKNVVVSNKAIYDEMKKEALENLKQKQEGDLLKGKVARITDFGAFIDLGGIEGLLHRNDISWSRVARVEDFLKVGDEIEVVLLKKDEENMKISLGLKQKTPEPWSVIDEKFKEGDVVEGIVKNIADFGAFVEIMPGIEGLLHISDISWKKIYRVGDALQSGEKVKVKILKIDKDNKKVSLGIKQLTEDPWEKIEEIYPIGSVVKAKVSKIIDSGIFVDLDANMEGFVHIGDFSWTKRISHPSEVVSEGQEIELKVIDIDREKRRVKLSLKHLTENPWDKIAQKIKEGDVVEGTVKNITNFGAFIEIEEGVEGLLHISEMSWTKKINHPEDVLRKGEKIKVKVLKVDSDNKKIELGLKQLSENPWDKIEEKYPVGSIQEGKVVSLKNFGAFVELEEGIEGLVHVKDFSWTKKINHPSEMVKIGDKVKVKILDIDKQNKKIALGIKQTQENPMEKYSVGLITKGKVVEILPFGAIIELSPEVRGLVHISEISEDRIEKVEDVLNVGDEVEVKVIDKDTDERKIKLSIKEAKYGKITDQYVVKNQGDTVLGEKLSEILKKQN